MSIVTPTLLVRAGASQANADRYGALLAASCAARGVTATSDLLNLLAMVLHESGMLTVVHEIMNYTTAARLVSVFPSHFRTIAQALPYVGQPEKLGNYVYAAFGGYADRGDSLGQVTGVHNFTAYAAAVGRPVAEIGDYMATPEGAVDAPVWYFVTNGCRGLGTLACRQKWAGCGPGVTPIGLADCQRLYALMAKLVGASAAAAPAQARPAPAAVAPPRDDPSTAALNDASLAGSLDYPTDS
jgi:putative chitinase